MQATRPSWETFKWGEANYLLIFKLVCYVSEKIKSMISLSLQPLCPAPQPRNHLMKEVIWYLPCFQSVAATIKMQTNRLLGTSSQNISYFILEILFDFDVTLDYTWICKMLIIFFYQFYTSLLVSTWFNWRHFFFNCWVLLVRTCFELLHYLWFSVFSYGP